MAGVNKVILIGHLGKDPEVRTTDSGMKVARFPLATTEAYKDKNGERKEITEWHNIVCWRNLADISEKYLVKGKLIYVEGKLRTRSWEDNGVKRYIVEVIADNFVMLGTKGDSVTTSTTSDNAMNTMPPASPTASATEQESTPVASLSKENLPPFLTEEEDDLPF
jgi:single-strand DNA-binding protein